MADRTAHQGLEWGVATRCRHGEQMSGDLGVITLLPDGALVAGIDGLGHGREAARAARAAADAIRAAPSRDLGVVVERCHAALEGTRGAAISLAFMPARERVMSWLGVGNVEGRLVSGAPAATGPKGSLALARGVAGHELPALQVSTLELSPGDVLLLATDGIAAVFADSPDMSGSARAISERILAEHRKPPDDALVVAVRYLGVRR